MTVSKFPERGVFRNEDGEITGIYHGYTRDEARNKEQEAIRAAMSLPLANKIAVSRGYDGIFSVPEEERFEIIRHVMDQLNPANDRTV